MSEYKIVSRWPYTSSLGGAVTITGLPPASTTTGSVAGGNLVPAIRHTYSHWEFWGTLLPWRWGELADLLYWLLRGDREYVVSRYFSRWANEPCSELCECD